MSKVIWNRWRVRDVVTNALLAEFERDQEQEAKRYAAEHPGTRAYLATNAFGSQQLLQRNELAQLLGDDELPAMWSESDLIGGETDCSVPSDQVTRDRERLRTACLTDPNLPCLLRKQAE